MERHTSILRGSLHLAAALPAQSRLGPKEVAILIRRYWALGAAEIEHVGHGARGRVTYTGINVVLQVPRPVSHVLVRIRAVKTGPVPRRSRPSLEQAIGEFGFGADG